MGNVRDVVVALKGLVRNRGVRPGDKVTAEVTLQVVSKRLEEKTDLQRNYTKLLNTLEKREREVQIGVPARSTEVDATINLLRDGVKRLKVLEEELEQKSRALALAS